MQINERGNTVGEQLGADTETMALTVGNFFEESVAQKRQNKTFTSINIATDEGKRLAYKCMTAADTPNEKLKDEVFIVENIFIHEVTLLDEETGERMNIPRTVLVSPDGKTTAFVSQGILSSIQNLAMLYGMPPWKPGLKVMLKESKTRKKFTVYNLQLVV